jgi:nicotinamide riboside kinase
MKLVFFGSESSGKTTLALQISQHFSALYCPEYVREYLTLRNLSPQRKGIVSIYDDIEPMSIGQAALEASFEKSLGLSQQNLLCYDTNIETNYIYSLYYFEKVPTILEELVQKKQYDLYFLLYPDTPWEDDGLRDSPHNRLAMHQLFKDYLLENNRNFIEIKGDVTSRFAQVQQIISTLLHQKS